MNGDEEIIQTEEVEQLEELSDSGLESFDVHNEELNLNNILKGKFHIEYCLDLLGRTPSLLKNKKVILRKISLTLSGLIFEEKVSLLKPRKITDYLTKNNK